MIKKTFVAALLLIPAISLPAAEEKHKTAKEYDLNTVMMFRSLLRFITDKPVSPQEANVLILETLNGYLLKTMNQKMAIPPVDSELVRERKLVIGLLSRNGQQIRPPAAPKLEAAKQ